MDSTVRQTMDSFMARLESSELIQITGKSYRLHGKASQAKLAEDESQNGHIWGHHTSRQ